jgi:hypothetical protein
MTANLSPAARVRRRFLQGGVSKHDVLLSPLGAVSAAVESLTEVLGYISEREPTLAASPENVGVVLVCFSKGRRLTRRVHPDHKHTRILLNELARLPHFLCIGLVLFVQELVDGSPRVSGWAKPFLWGDDNVAILGGVLEKLLKRFGKGEWLIQ